MRAKPRRFTLKPLRDNALACGGSPARRQTRSGLRTLRRPASRMNCAEPLPAGVRVVQKAQTLDALVRPAKPPTMTEP
jgi:hypothetical protein